MLVIAAPTDDITDLDIAGNSRVELKKCVERSCHNLLDIAKESLVRHPELKKIILFEHTPRFDANIRSELAMFANEALKCLIDDPKVDSKIKLGKHNLSCYGIGKTYDNRFKNSILKQGDGLHFFGPSGSRDFSESMVNILNKFKVNITDNVTFENGIQTELPLRNRFEIFNQGNL